MVDDKGEHRPTKASERATNDAKRKMAICFALPFIVFSRWIGAPPRTDYFFVYHAVA